MSLEDLQKPVFPENRPLSPAERFLTKAFISCGILSFIVIAGLANPSVRTMIGLGPR